MKEFREWRAKLLSCLTYAFYLPQFLLLILVASCHRTVAEENNGHPCFDTLFARLDALKIARNAQALALLDSAYHAFPNPGVMDLYRKYAFLRGWAEDIDHDPVKINRYADSLLLVAGKGYKEKKLASAYGHALLVKGTALMKLKNYSEAFQYYSRGKLLIQQIPDSCQLSGIYSGEMGDVCFKQAKYAEAALYYRQAFDELAHCNAGPAYDRFRYQVGMLNNLALTYDKRDVPDSALYYYNQSLQMVQKGRSLYPRQYVFINSAEGVIEGNMGTVYQKKGAYDLAEQFYRKEITINAPREYDHQSAQITLGKLAGLYLETARFGKARETLQQLRTALDTSSYNEPAELQWRKLQWNYLDTLHRTKEAYLAFQRYVALRDSVNNNARRLAHLDIDKEYKALQQQYEIGLLTRENRLKQVYLFIAIVFSVMTLVIVLLVWRNAQRSRKNLYLIGLHNKQMEITLESLEQRNREYARLNKVLAHDLRNPIGGISGLAVLLQESEHLSYEEQESLVLIQSSCDWLLKTINDLLLDNTNPEAKKLQVAPADISLLLADCVALLQFRASEKKQTIRFRKIPGTTVLIDRNKMWRVFNNLLVNAIKFSPEKSEIRVLVEKKASSLLVCVADNGIGIPDELKEKIFDPSAKAGREGTSGEPSFGLGLSISKQIVLAHGGKIWFESMPGAGTRFYVEIPVVEMVEGKDVAVQVSS